MGPPRSRCDRFHIDHRIITAFFRPIEESTPLSLGFLSMDKEISPGVHNAPLPRAFAQPGLPLPAGTEFDSTKMQFTNNFRMNSADAEAGVFAFTKYYSEFNLLNYFRDAVMLSKMNGEFLINISLERDFRRFIDINISNFDTSTDNHSAPDYCNENQKHKINIEISTEISMNIYVKDRNIAADRRLTSRYS